MSDPQDRQRLAKIALKRRAVAVGSAGPTSAAPASGASPEDLDDAFDRSFGETFGDSGAAPDAAGSLSDIDIDVSEPVRASQAGGPPGDEPPDEGLRALALQHGVPAIDLDRVTIDLAHLAYVPREVAARTLILPVAVRDGNILVAVADPSQRRILDELEFVTGLHVVPHVADPAQVKRFVEACYRSQASGDRAYAMPGALPPGVLQGAVARPGPASPPAPADHDLLTESSVASPVDLDATPVPVPPAAPARLRESAQRRILVVDDENDIRSLVVRVFRDRGFEVLEAAHGADALRLVQTQTPDAIVLDAMLPEIHGFEVCRRIKRSPKYGRIPIVMISAIYRGWRFAHDLKQSYGVDHFLEKPFKINDLVEQVQRLLTGTAAADPVRELTGRAQAEFDAGVRAYRQGDLDGAIAHLRRGIEADASSHKMHYHLGVLYGKKGRIYEAIQEFEASLEIEPGDFATLRGLAQLYEHAGFRYKAVEMWERAAGAAPDEAGRTSIKEHLLSLL